MCDSEDSMKYTIKGRMHKDEYWTVLVVAKEMPVMEVLALAQRYKRTYRYVELTSFQPE